MKISYNWLKSYVPNLPEAEKLWEIFTYHICEVEEVEKLKEDVIFDINILPNRAHDLLSHQGIARELASLLNLDFIDPTPKYKILQSKKSSLQIEIKSDKCRRYMGRIVRNVKVNESPEWIKTYLESIGQKSINNIVDVANIVMYDSGQPVHCFDLDKVQGPIIVRNAKEGEQVTTLDGKIVELKPSNLVIADKKNILAIAGVKGGKIAEVDKHTKNIIIEVANFDPVSIRKTWRKVNIFTDAAKRFENNLSPELSDFGMLEMSALIADIGNSLSVEKLEFEDIVDIYPNKQKARRLSFSAKRMSKILGIEIKDTDIENILKRYNFEYNNKGGAFEIIAPSLRLDLEIEEDMAEEMGRILGYDKISPKIPKINFKPKINQTFAKIFWARNKLLKEGYSEVMTYVFRNKGEIGVQKSPSDKKFLRTNITDGLQESVRLNQVNKPLLNIDKVQVFEIGTVFLKEREQINIAYGDKKEIKEMSLDEFCRNMPSDFNFNLKYTNNKMETMFKMWSLFPFIVRDIALWVPENTDINIVKNIIKEHMGNLVINGPEVFDTFQKDKKISYAFRLIFQSNSNTLRNEEVNIFMDRIYKKLTEKGFEIR